MMYIWKKSFKADCSINYFANISLVDNCCHSCFFNTCSNRHTSNNFYQ